MSLGNAGNNFDGYLPSFNIDGDSNSEITEDSAASGGGEGGGGEGGGGEGGGGGGDGGTDEFMEREAMAEWESTTSRYCTMGMN